MTQDALVHMTQRSRGIRVSERLAAGSMRVRQDYLIEVIDSLVAATFGGQASSPYAAEVRRAEQRVVAERLMRLAARARMPQVRAVPSLERRASDLTGMVAGADEANAAAYALLARDIRRVIDRPCAADSTPGTPDAPPSGDERPSAIGYDVTSDGSHFVMVRRDASSVQLQVATQWTALLSTPAGAEGK